MSKKTKVSDKKAMRDIAKRVVDANTEDKVMWQKLPTNFSSIGIWNEQNICKPAQGTASNQRVGKKIKVKSIEIKGTIAAGSSASALDDPYDTVRIIVATWNAANDTPMTTLEAATAGMINSPVKKGVDDFALLIKKYLDKYIPLTAVCTEKGAGDGYVPQLKTFKFYKRFKNGLPITFSDEGVTYPEKRLCLSMGSDSVAIPHPGFTDGYVIVHFEDA